MNDYVIDEKLLREFRESAQPTKKYSNPPQTSVNAAYKRELNELDHKLKTMEKAYSKITKKYSDCMEEIRTLKMQNDSLNNQVNILQITNEKILGEKTSYESQLEELKVYTRKIESRLVNGAKNQHLVEINNKLRKDLEEYKHVISNSDKDYDKLKTEITKKNQEIKILNKALELKIEEMKFKGDVKSSLLYDVGMVKQEMDECQEQADRIKEENLKLQSEVNLLA